MYTTDAEMFSSLYNFAKRYLKTSDNVTHSSNHSTSPDPEIEDVESLQDRLFHLDLNEKSVEFISEHGDEFVDYPEALAERLSIKVSVAKEALDELKAYKIDQISKEEIQRFELLVKENPQKDPKEIALSRGIGGDVLSAYLASSETNLLTDSAKATITEKYNNGFSITEIAKQLNVVSQVKIKDYVECTFITFNGEEGNIILEIITRNFETYPITKLKEMILTKSVKLQEQICCQLLERNEEEYKQLENYFMKFEGSRKFLEIDATLSIEAKNDIRTSSLEDIGELSLKLNKMESVIRDYILRYSQDEELMLDCAQRQLKQIQEIKASFGTDREISHTTYRMIISDSNENLIQNAKHLNGSPKRILDELLPLAFYYIKCSLPLDEFTQIITSITNISLTTLDIFHLIFQMSDPVVRGLCIEHYSFSNPVPLYYPILESHTPELKCSQFEICKELWYSLQQFSGLVSFGLGWASWNPIGKSHLLDLIFKTDFEKGSPHSSPFHMNSIDIQMTKNLFGKKGRNTQESTEWAYIDCHGCPDINFIGEICQNLDIALIHVSYSDYRENYSRLTEDLIKITANTKDVYVLVRDCMESDVNTKQVILEGKTFLLIFIPNLIQHNASINIVSELKKIGYTILHSLIEVPKLVGSNFLENLITRNDNWANLKEEKELIEWMKSNCTNSQDTDQEFSFLSYYPHFVEYMRCFYKASTETDQKNIDQLNKKSELLEEHLKNAEMSAIVWQFNEILAQQNSTLILWKLSQELNMLSKQQSTANNKTPFTLEILWREALLSNKYNVNPDGGKPESKYFEIFSSNFSNHVERGEPFELIDGDNLRFFNQDIDVLLSKLYEQQFCNITKNKNKTRAPIVVSIFGPQSSGKSTLLNYCFGCKFLTSAGRCTKGVYASLSKLSQPINHSDHFLILDTEGLDAIEKGKTLQDTSCIHFDRTMVLFCLAVSEVVIINVKGDIGEEMRNLLQICAYSLNKLKVSKVATPKIFFVLNQQADPDPDKHLNSINTLLEKLNKESYLLDTEGLKISDLIQVSKENLFVLPSAFNSESLNSQVANLFDSHVCKLSPTVDFVNKCADIRVSIILQLKNDSYDATDSNNTNHNYTVPFDTMSEWLEMSGVIWDTIVKYQDIVKYSNTEEIKCSNKLGIILNDIMRCRIYLNEEEYREITKKLISEIKGIARFSPPNVILEKVKEKLNDAFEKYQEKALTDFASQCEADPLLMKLSYMCEEAKSNLCRLIYVEKKIYEDKLKLQIKARLTEIKHEDNMVKFQQIIEKNADKYLELTITEQDKEFEEVWVHCFGSFDKEEEEAEFYEKFEDLYSVFMMESKTMENRHTLYSQFCDHNFDMESKIQLLSKTMLSKFSENNSGTDQFIYPWKENKTPLKEMTPYTGKFNCEYLTSESLFFKKEKKRTSSKTKSKIGFKRWVPRSCTPLIEYCSGYYNHPDIIWKLEKKKQILLLASRLRDPNNLKRSTWEKFLHDISERIQEITEKDPDISHSTVKEIVDILCHICRVVNYEINFIEAKLTNAAERTLSTYAFGLAFKSSLKLKKDKLRENILIEREKRETNLDYFLQKVENRKLAKGNWDRKKMRDGDKTIANKFARDFLAAVWRKVSTECEHNVNERYFVSHKYKLSHKTILLLANENITEEVNRCHEDSINEENVIIQHTCNRTQNLKQLFREEWIKLANELHDKIVGTMRESFSEQIAKIKYVLTEFLNDLVANCEKLDRVVDIGSDSDSNFEVTNKTIELTGNSDSRSGVIPFKAMVSFLELYLDPKVCTEEFEKHFKDEFVVDGVAVKKHHDTYVLFEKPLYATQVLEEDLFKSLTETTMFRSTETIFNIKVYVQEFLRVLNCYEYQVSEAEYGKILKSTKEEFEARVINCLRQCPSCGKFCEKEIHPHGGRCQIMTGHQICSMGGNVWNTNEDRTAILLMCEDYRDDTPVLIPGQCMKWWQFKEKCGDQWDWSLPTDEEYVALRNKNREQMKEIWNKFGREILKYYANKGTQITYIPYTTHEEIYESLFLRYFICFVIDGTDLMGGTINFFKTWISDIMKDAPRGTSCFKVIVYHGHAVNRQKCVEKFPNNSQFTTDATSIQHFLQTISTYGSEGNEIPMLHGLATATTECDWKSGLGVENVIFHFYIEPTKGHFDASRARGRCNQGVCLFDWERDIKDKIDNLKIDYKYERYINKSHPSYADCTGFVSHQVPSRLIRDLRKESDPKPSILINYETDN